MADGCGGVDGCGAGARTRAGWARWRSGAAGRPHPPTPTPTPQTAPPTLPPPPPPNPTKPLQVRYACLVFRPARGEVLDCVVASVSKVGFFADAGPMQVFVSSHLLPDDYSYDAAGEAAFVAGDAGARVCAGCEVRLRVVGVRMDANEVFCVASMKDDYLGVINSPGA